MGVKQAFDETAANFKKMIEPAGRNLFLSNRHPSHFLSSQRLKHPPLSHQQHALPRLVLCLPPSRLRNPSTTLLSK